MTGRTYLHTRLEIAAWHVLLVRRWETVTQDRLFKEVVNHFSIDDLFERYSYSDILRRAENVCSVVLSSR